MLTRVQAKHSSEQVVAVIKRQFHQQTRTAAASGLFGKLFGNKKVEDQVSQEDPSPVIGDSVQEDVSLKKDDPIERFIRVPSQPKFPKRSYTPERLEFRVKKVLESNEIALNTDNWKATSLTDRQIKFKVLSDTMKYIKLPVSDRALNNIQNVDDLITELSREPVNKDAGHVVAQFYDKHSDDLPSNMKFEPFTKHGRKLHAFK